MATPTNPNEGGKTVPAAQLAFKVVKWEALEDGEKVFVKEDEVTFDHPVARDKDDRPLVESAIKWWDLEYYSNKTSPVELPYSHGLVRTQIVSVKRPHRPLPDHLAAQHPLPPGHQPPRLPHGRRDAHHRLHPPDELILPPWLGPPRLRPAGPTATPPSTTPPVPRCQGPSPQGPPLRC
ncbi:hypothetical protein [Streptomyces sp. NPDC101145]|uniref:hypothetical protein n=1 Tax=Streptomyces sp. NPDC101145 TaxID=3366112 RepID=UPI0037FCB355